MSLFPFLRSHPPALPDDELRLLRDLPLYTDNDPVVRAVEQEDEATCRRLERRGLVKVHRWKDDPIATRPTLYAGRLPASTLRST